MLHIADFVKYLISHPSELRGFRPIEVNTNDYFLSGHPATRLISVFTLVGGTELQEMLLITTLEGKLYVVTYDSTPFMPMMK